MSETKSSQDGTDKRLIGRASRDSLDDFKLRLKVLDALAGNKDLFGKDIMKSLVSQSDKKSDDDTLEESLRLLLEAKRKQEKEVWLFTLWLN